MYVSDDNTFGGRGELAQNEKGTKYMLLTTLLGVGLAQNEKVTKCMLLTTPLIQTHTLFLQVDGKDLHKKSFTETNKQTNKQTNKPVTTEFSELPRRILYLRFRASLIYINNCPTTCNTKQPVYYSASSLYMFRVSTTPIIRSTQNCNYSLQRGLELGHVGQR